MFNFGSLTSYSLNWTENGPRQSLTAAEIATIDHAVVEQSNFGLSACFYLKNGGHKYIPLSRDSKLGLGDVVDPAKGEVITISREGDDDKYRWQETF